MVRLCVINIILAICLIIGHTLVEAKPSELISDSDNGENKGPVDITSGEVENVESFDAFLSYRRAMSRNLAMLLKILLERENVNAFIDVEDLKGGLWDRQLISGIQHSPNFILLLGNGTLDRCRGDVNYTDFMHKEIREAVITNSTIVLVYDDFDFPVPEEFSPEIQKALSSPGLTWEHKEVDQSVKQLLSYMSELGPARPPSSPKIVLTFL